MVYLGVTLDSRLSWVPHVTKKVNKARRCFAMLKPMINYIWGPSPQKIKWIWNQIILPGFTYGCHVWGHKAIMNLGLRKKNSRLTRMGLKGYCPMWKTTPTAGLEVLLNHRPIHLHLWGVALRNFIRIHTLIPKKWTGIGLKKTRWGTSNIGKICLMMWIFRMAAFWTTRRKS